MSNIDWSKLRKAADIMAEAELARLAPLIAEETQWVESERNYVAEQLRPSRTAKKSQALSANGVTTAFRCARGNRARKAFPIPIKDLHDQADNQRRCTGFHHARAGDINCF